MMSDPAPPTGTLFVVSTPIGNLEDITLRALRVLREARAVAAEDTRRTGQLLAHFGIATPTISLHEHNEHTRTPQLISRLLAGDSIALVTDAGTPLLSDPGLTFVREAIDAGIRVEPVPGCSALLPALVASGLPTDQFAFLGFPPNKATARRAFFQQADALGLPFVIFEAPHRLVASLKDARDVLGPRRVSAARELTKLHEEHVRGSLDALLEHFSTEAPRGEFTLVFAASDSEAADALGAAEASDEEVWREFCLLTKAGRSRREAIAELGRRLGRPSREIYASVERGKLGSAETSDEEEVARTAHATTP
jgi:16S rRNA (cytidine1402-2'-O)-methyltransferase